MSLKVSKAVASKIYQRQLYRSLFSHQIVNKTSSAYQIGNLKKRNEDRSSFSILSKNNCYTTTLCHPSGSLYINFHKRNASNDASTVGNLEKMYNSSSQFAVENATPTDEATNFIARRVANTMWDISDWKIVEYGQNTLLKVHEMSGLPWWASIALTAITAKTLITLPFALFSMHNAAKLNSLKEKFGERGQKIREEISYIVKYHGWPESLAEKEYKKRIRIEWKKLVIEHNCHPAKSYILVLVQMPVWLSFSVACRNLCYMLPHQDIAAQLTYMELTTGGFGWVKNLAMFDPYIILPVTVALTNLILIEMYNMWKLTPPTKFDKYKTIFFRLVTGFVIVIGVNMPAAVNVYWLTSSAYGLGQALLLMSPRVRRRLGMPPGETELEHPYRHLYTTMKSRLRLGAA